MYDQSYFDDILNEFELNAKNELKKNENFIDHFKSNNNLYQELSRTMISERLAPEILPFKAELLKNTLSGIENKRQFLIYSNEYDIINDESDFSKSSHKLELILIQTEIERLSFLIRIYLRTRISKIDSHLIYYLKKVLEPDKQNDKLLFSDNEIIYMKKHFQILTNLYNDTFLKKIPSTLTLLDDTSAGQSMIQKPFLDQHVFIKSTSKIPITIILDSDKLQLENDGNYILRYKLVKEYLETNDLMLI